MAITDVFGEATNRSVDITDGEIARNDLDGSRAADRRLEGIRK